MLARSTEFGSAHVHREDRLAGRGGGPEAENAPGHPLSWSLGTRFTVSESPDDLSDWGRTGARNAQAYALVGA